MLVSLPSINIKVVTPVTMTLKWTAYKGTSLRHAHSLSYSRLAEKSASGEERAWFVNNVCALVGERFIFRCFIIHC